MMATTRTKARVTRKILAASWHDSSGEEEDDDEEAGGCCEVSDIETAMELPLPLL